MRNWNKGCTSFIMLLLIALLNFGFLLESASSREIPVKYSKVRVYANSNEDILSLNEAGLAFEHALRRCIKLLLHFHLHLDCRIF